MYILWLSIIVYRCGRRCVCAAALHAFNWTLSCALNRRKRANEPHYGAGIGIGVNVAVSIGNCLATATATAAATTSAAAAATIATTQHWQLLHIIGTSASNLLDTQHVWCADKERVRRRGWKERERGGRESGNERERERALDNWVLIKNISRES